MVLTGRAHPCNTARAHSHLLAAASRSLTKQVYTSRCTYCKMWSQGLGSLAVLDTWPLWQVSCRGPTQRKKKKKKKKVCRFWPNHRQDVAHRAFQQPATSSSSVSFLGFMGVPRIRLQATQPFILLFLSAFHSHPTRNHLREKTKL